MAIGGVAEYRQKIVLDFFRWGLLRVTPDGIIERKDGSGWTPRALYRRGNRTFVRIRTEDPLLQEKLDKRRREYRARGIVVLSTDAEERLRTYEVPAATIVYLWVRGQTYAENYCVETQDGNPYNLHPNNLQLVPLRERMGVRGAINKKRNRLPLAQRERLKQEREDGATHAALRSAYNVSQSTLLRILRED